MKQTDVTVTFYLKKSEMNDEGHCPVMAKLVVGKFSEAAFSAKMSVPAALWASGRATGKSNAAREINRQLDDLRASAIPIYDELSATRENVTAEEIRNLLCNLQIFLCLFLEKLNMPQNTPVTKAS